MNVIWEGSQEDKTSRTWPVFVTTCADVTQTSWEA